MIVGLTGSIGMGKSTVAALFADEGIPIFCADAAVHAMQAAGGELIDEIEAVFPGTTGENGVDRQALGAAVLGDRDKLARLEAIVHPAVARLRVDFLAEHAGADIILFDIPLLFEKSGQAGVDVSVVVSAPAPIMSSIPAAIWPKPARKCVNLSKACAPHLRHGPCVTAKMVRYQSQNERNNL